MIVIYVVWILLLINRYAINTSIFSVVPWNSSVNQPTKIVVHFQRHHEFDRVCPTGRMVISASLAPTRFLEQPLRQSPDNHTSFSVSDPNRSSPFTRPVFRGSLLTGSQDAPSQPYPQRLIDPGKTSDASAPSRHFNGPRDLAATGQRQGASGWRLRVYQLRRQSAVLLLSAHHFLRSHGVYVNMVQWWVPLV